MFEKEIYIRRRRTLVQKMHEAGAQGLLLFIGNAEAPAQYKDNCYKFRQDSTWLYFFGLDEPLMAAVIDLESGEETRISKSDRCFPISLSSLILFWLRAIESNNF